MDFSWKLFIITTCTCLSADRGSTYIIDSDFRPVCPSVQCSNGGTLIEQSCICECRAGFGGFFCEKELHESDWPKGTYSMLASVFGCPEQDELYGWHRGYVNMTVAAESSLDQRWKLPYPPNPDYLESNTADPHLLGPYYLRSLQWNFCTRHDLIYDHGASSNSDLFPRGQYCVFRFNGTCPKKFSESQVTLTGYLLSWSDIDGTIPDLTLNDKTGEPTFMYCCRADDVVNDTDLNHITFPATYPFILTKPNGSHCMDVQSMLVTEERFDLVDESSRFVFDGLHNMFYTTEDGYQRLALCYYAFETYENCYYEEDGGFSYQGTTNHSKFGNPCVHWYDIPDEASVETFRPHKNYVGDFNHNHCRTYFPYGDFKYHPWCFVNRTGSITWEACDIPVCETGDSLEIVGKYKPVYSVPARPGDETTKTVDGLFDEPFVSDRPRQKAWLQVDLEETLEVHAVVIYRSYFWFANNIRFASVHVSNYQWDFLNYGAVQCQERRYPRRAPYFRFQCYRPIQGQYITIRNFDDTDPVTGSGNYYRLEIAEIQILVKRNICSRRMGTVSGGIRDFQFGGSTELISNIYEDGIIFNEGEGWCSRSFNNSYFEVDMVVPVVINGIEIQGTRDTANVNLVREFYVEYSVNDHEENITYTTPVGHTKIFKTDQSAPLEMILRYMFQKPFVARKLRIHIIEPSSDVCLKLEVIGCPKRVSRDLYCRDDAAIMYGYEAVTSSVYWIENIPVFNEPLDTCLARCTAMPECIGTLHNKGVCSVYTSSRYNTHFQHWFLKKANSFESSTFTKLCIKDISEYTDCGSVITGPSVLVSPSYPLYYGMLLSCSWQIQFPESTYVRIQITDLHLPEPDVSTLLRERGYYDIRIGSCSDRIMLDELTIDHTNQLYYRRSVLVSSSNKMVIQLTSCARYSLADAMSGFRMEITQSDYPGCGMTTSQCDNTCTSNTGIIASPGFPTPTDEISLCTWRIVGQLGQYIMLTFKVIDVRSSNSECNEAKITVRDVARFKAPQDSDPILGPFCSLHTPDGPLKSSWEILEIEFTTTDRAGSGFMAEYEMMYQVQEFTGNSSDGCLDGWEAFNTSCYNLFYESEGLTWRQAETQCHRYSGHLVSLQSRHETNFVHYLLTSRWTNILNDSQDFYIGLQKIEENGFFKDWLWTDGSPVTFTAWYQSTDGGSNQPDGLGHERCTFISLSSIHSINNWHDVPCAYDQLNMYICEASRNFSDAALEDQIAVSMTRSVVHHSNMFQCENRDMIHTIYVCDEVQDCINGTDESMCDKTGGCHGYQFECKDGRCIPGDLLCDFRHDCNDGSDEQACVYADCANHEWRCSSGQCIPAEYRCDVKRDCFDGSDEEACYTCQNTTFQCYDQKCTSRSRVCDLYYDCSGRFFEDEIQEGCNSNSRLQSCASWYSIGRRNNGSYSILIGTNDGVSVECSFIEENGNMYADTIIHHQHESELVQESIELMLNLEYKANDIQLRNLKGASTSCKQHIRFDCSYTNSDKLYWVGDSGREFYNRDLSDPCACPLTLTCNGTQRCNCGIEKVEEWYGLDNDVFFSDQTFITDLDELPIRDVFLPDVYSNFDPVYKAQIGPFVCREKIEAVTEYSIVCGNGVLGPIESVCKLTFDVYGDIVGCRDLSHLENCENFDCPPGYTKCPYSYCIWSGLVCDGVSHCTNGEDEIHCNTQHNCEGLFHCRSSELCIPTANVCDDIIHCPLSDDELLCNVTCPRDCTCDKRTMLCSSLAFLNASDSHAAFRSITETRILKVSLSEDLGNLHRFLGLTHLDLASSELSALVPGQFKFASNLVYLDMSGNQLIEIPAAAFDGLNKLTNLNLQGNPLKRLMINSFMGLRSLKNLDLSGFSLGRLERGVFSGLEAVENLTLTSSNINEIEDRTFESLNASLILDLRQNSILEFGKFLFAGLDSLQQLFVDSFTLCCIKPSGLNEDQCWSPRNEFSSCSDLLRNEILSVCIWVIGIVATIGNIIVLVIRFILDKDGLKKTYNVFVCNLSVADCLMGIYLIILAIADAAFRGEYTWNDYKWRNGTACKVAGVISTIASEGSVIFLCLITIDRLLVVKFPFGNVRISKNMSIVLTMTIWAIVLLLACVPLIGETYFSWSFYSRSAVCLPLPLTRDTPVGYEYAVGLFIVFNFIAFLLIATGQVVIYLEISSTRNNTASRGRRVDMTVARKLFFVAITDFMCWFPIGLMGIMALNGQVISGEVYAWIAVFVLPINSALNPFLYTLGSSLTTIFNKLEGKLLRSKSSRRERETKSVTDVVSSDMFVFGHFDARDKRKIGLKRYLEFSRVTTLDIYRIVRHVSKSLEMLHCTEMVHGRVSIENVMVTLAKGKINRVMLRSSPITCIDEEDFKKDIDELGNLLRGLLRLVDKN